MSNQVTYSTRAPSFSALITLVFVALKLTDNIDWSWWWVLSPLWISFIVGVLVLLVAVVVLAWTE